MKVRGFAAVLFAALTTSVAAQPEISADVARGLVICSGVEDSGQRLTCYDVLLRNLTVHPAAAASVPSKWRVRTETSPVDDSENVFVSVSGEDGIEDQYGRSSTMVLMLACRENTTSAWVNFGGHFMSSATGHGRVTYRIDSSPAETKSFQASNDHKALGLWNGGSAIPWIKSMFGGQRMYLEATPFTENGVSDFFPIAGLEDAIAPLRKSCGW